MREIYLGSFFPFERTDEIIKNSKANIDNAANNFQWALINGLSHHYPNLELITLPVIGSFPFKYKKIRFTDSFFSYNDRINNCLGFFNFPLIKHISKLYNLNKFFKQIDKNEPITIFIYAIHSPFLKVVYDLKLKGYNIKICLVVPDLPQFMSDNKNVFYIFFKWIDAQLIKKYLKTIDSYVLFSDKMIDFIDVKEKPWVRIEGIYLPKPDISVSKENLNVILYTGALDYIYGIKNLIDAFLLIEDLNYELWICGNGDYINEIINKSLINTKIKYFGQLPFDEIQKLQRKATVLVNPRTSNGVYTKYSFPSKTMEYLASGTPCILFRLEGIPDEYYEYCFIPEQESAEALYKTILFVCKKDESELKELGERAKKFILENKNPEIQCKKIYDMLSKKNNIDENTK